MIWTILSAVLFLPAVAIFAMLLWLIRPTNGDVLGGGLG